jgi:hypothetical protein
MEKTPVRMDLSHSCWSDIFFLGMDFPEGAKVLNVSVDLAVEGRDAAPIPPICVGLRVLDEPVLRLVSVDLGASADITDLGEVFDFARDYLGLLKAAVIASGIVPMGVEGSGARLDEVLAAVLGPGKGLELVSHVNGIPKGSRLAVSTNLLAGLIAACMRATRQTTALEGPLLESERRLVAARAILGEWLGGSGGGWQDSGGVWPGIKVIEGCTATSEDPEWNISRGRLLPQHRVIGQDEITEDTRRRLAESLILVHGGMAQNVGPILEMVTEKYLLRSAHAWAARKESMALFDEMLDVLRRGDIRALGQLTTRHFFGPLQTVIPWASNAFTEDLIARVKAGCGEAFWGFWMLGGMSGGGMGFIVDPEHAPALRAQMPKWLAETKSRFSSALPFAMDPVVYSFRINESGTAARLLKGADALMTPAYYPHMIPAVVRADPRTIAPARLAEARRFASVVHEPGSYATVVGSLLRNLLPHDTSGARSDLALDPLLAQLGFDGAQHERIRKDLQAGRIGLAQNRLPPSTRIEDPVAAELTDVRSAPSQEDYETGCAALRAGEVAVVTLAAGAGSRWTEGAGVVKALHPFARLLGRHRSFLEVHLAKSRKIAETYGAAPPHIFTTGYLTHAAIENHLERWQRHDYPGTVRLSFGRSIGLRLVPTERDLRFSFQESLHQLLDERKQRVQESLNEALIQWARRTGEGSDYRDNVPNQCIHPVGHWFEIPNLLLNGTLHELIALQPTLRTLLLHNIDTLGVALDPALLGRHRALDQALSFEVISRRWEDRGGGLAKVDGRLRLVEGLALPNERDEFNLSYYNTLTTWIEIDPLLKWFGLDRKSLADPLRIQQAVRDRATSLPTYVTLKNVKKRWGHGQEDVFPVAQFEKLWGDMSALPDISSAFLLVPRIRGQQLKAQAQLDGWMRDGSAAFIESLMSA